MEDQPTRLRGDDHDLLIRLDENVLNLMRRVDEQHTTILQLISDLQKRVTVIESWKQNLSGRLSIVAALAAIVSSIISAVVVQILTR